MAAPILFIHGAFCGGWAFDAFRAPFNEAGFETHAPNLPFHERGADLEALAQTGVKDYAEAMIRYARNLKHAPIIVGHSLGGLIAQVVAANIKTTGLVLLAPTAPWGVPPTTMDETGNAFGVAMLGDYWRRAIPPDYRVARHSTLDRLPRDDARRAFARFSPESGRAIMEAVHWWADRSMASAAPVYKIEAPVLALAGGQDRVNPASTVRRIAARFPQGQAHFHEFSEMSHWLIGEPEWAQVARMTLDWLSSHNLTAAKPKRKTLKLFSANAAP
ncbi:MAG: alpha/beta hydrolase [Hyphomonadaceae bacterium]